MGEGTKEAPSLGRWGKWRPGVAAPGTDKGHYPGPGQGTLGPKMVMAVVTRLVVTRSDRLTGGNGGAKVVDVGRQVSR